MRWLISALAYVLLTCASLAQVGQIPIFAPPVISGGSITWTSVTPATIWVNISIGTATTFHPNNSTAFPANSLACVWLANREDGSSIAPRTITIDGTTATDVASDIGAGGTLDSGGSFLNLYCVTKATFASDAVVVSGANSFSWTGIAGGYFQNFTSATPTATGCNGENSSGAMTILVTCNGSATTITVPSSGIGLTAIWSQAGTAGTSCATPTWTTASTSNITASGGDVNGCNNTFPALLATAHTVTVGTWGPIVNLSPAAAFNTSMAAATFH